MEKLMSAQEAASFVREGDTVMVGGFGNRGYAESIMHVLAEFSDVGGLTIVTNSPSQARPDLEKILETRCKRLKCSFMPDSPAATALYEKGRVDLIPQGTFAEAIRAAGVGVPAFFTPVGYGTEIARGKESRLFGGRHYILEESIPGDVSLLKVTVADKAGNCYLRRAMKNFMAGMAMASKRTYVEAKTVVEIGEIDPDMVTIPGIVVDGVVEVGE